MERLIDICGEKVFPSVGTVAWMVGEREREKMGVKGGESGEVREDM